MQTPYSNYGYAVTTLNALRTPDKVALTYRGQQYSFAALNQRVNVTANALLAIGLEPGMKMAVLLHDALPIAETYLALAKLGVTIVALNPYWEDDVMEKVLQHCEVQAMLGQHQDQGRISALRSSLGEMIPHWVQLEKDELPAATRSLAHEQENSGHGEPPIGSGGDNPMAYFFTSGTTGLPKAVVHTHNSCRSLAEIWLALPRDEDSVWGTGTIIWGIGFPCTIGAALFVGMQVALEDDFGPAGLLDAIQREPISHFCVIPSFWTDLLANHPHEDIDLSSISMVLLGGEPLAGSLLAKIKQRVPDAAIYAFYGQTEAPYTSFGRLDDGSQATNAVGQARPSCAAQVLDPNGDPVVGEAGELAVTGPHCMQGYFKQPDKTAEVLREGWFFSGDLALQDSNGIITVLGRREDAITRGGQFIQPLVIEDAVLGIEGVSEAGAVSIDNGTPDQSILLAVTVNGSAKDGTGKAITEQALAEQLAGLVPPGHLPDRIVIADELPHGKDNSGGKGKLLRREIREQYGHLVANQ